MPADRPAIILVPQILINKKCQQTLSCKKTFQRNKKGKLKIGQANYFLLLIISLFSITLQYKVHFKIKELLHLTVPSKYRANQTSPICEHEINFKTAILKCKAHWIHKESYLGIFQRNPNNSPKCSNILQILLH